MQAATEEVGQIALTILESQRSQIASFVSEWNASSKEEVSWVAKLDPSVSLLTQAYAAELRRLLAGRPATHDWINVLEQAQLLRRATLDHFMQLKTGRTSLPLSEPQNLADRTHGFLMDAAYQFASSLGELRKSFPFDIQFAEEVTEPGDAA